MTTKKANQNQPHQGMTTMMNQTIPIGTQILMNLQAPVVMISLE